MKKIKVLFMQSQTYYGADSQIHGLLMRSFDRKHVEVHAACNTGAGGEIAASLQALSEIPQLHLRPTFFGPSTHFVPKHIALRNALFGSLPTAASLVHLARYLRSQQIDVIHCTEKPRDAFYGLLLARASGARCVIHLHVKAESWISPLVRWAMGQADGLIGISAFVSESIRNMGYSPDRIYTVHNAMDLKRWDDTIDGSAVRLEYGIASNTPLLAIVSRLFHWKGHTELLRALALVKQHNPVFKLLIVGDDDPRATVGHGSYTAELKALVQELGLNDQVIFTGFRKDVPQIMAACDIFTMPSFEEPFGMVYTEAMAMRMPIIGLDNGGTREVVEHGKSGLLSAPQDSEGLAENILLLMSNPDLRQQMGVYGRQRVQNYFNPKRMADDMEQTYRCILR